MSVGTRCRHVWVHVSGLNGTHGCVLGVGAKLTEEMLTWSIVLELG